jgi:hypothetical protein
MVRIYKHDRRVREIFAYLVIKATSSYYRKIEGRLEVTRRRRRIRSRLLDDLKAKKGYCKLKEEALDRTLWRTRFGRGYGPAVRQTTE